MSESQKYPDMRPTTPTSGERLRTLYTIGVDQLWVEEHGLEPDRESDKYKAFSDEQLSGIDFENRQDWQKNAVKEKALSEAANRRMKSFTPKAKTVD